MFRAIPDDYDKSLYKAHSEAIFKSLLLHLDDPSPQIQARQKIVIILHKITIDSSRRLF